MPGYITKARIKYGHPFPKHPQHAPHKHVPVQYGAKTQWAEEDLTELPKQMEIKRIQDIAGALLYYARVEDPTLAAVLNTNAFQQTMATKQMEEACHQLLDYVATHPNAAVCFVASDMILVVHLDTSYLFESKARSRAAGHLYLATKNDEDYNNGV
eukprot:7638841-Ditylum_brightwellii.AAC.1